MSRFEAKARELLFNDKKSEVFCDTFVYEPANVEEENLGNLYITGEILPEGGTTSNSSYLINLLASIIKREYYSNYKRPALESLESGLHKANVALAEFAENGSTQWLGNLNFICAVFAGDFIHLTQVGKARSLLIRGGEITDIGENLLSANQKPHPLKTFSSVASGKLEERDKLIFSTRGLFDILSLEKLKNLLDQSPIDEALIKIQEQLTSLERTPAIGALVLEIAEPQAESLMERKDLEAESKERLRLEEIVDSTPRVEEPFSQTEESPLPEEKRIRRSPLLRKWPGRVLPYLSIAGRGSLKIGQWLGKNLWQLSKKGFYQAKELKEPSLKLLAQAKSFPRRVPRYTSVAISSYLRLPRSSKILLGTSVVLALLFIISLGFLVGRKDNQENLTYYSSLLAQGLEKQAQAEAALIYQDENKARGLLLETRAIVSQILESGYLQTEAKKLEQKAFDQFEKLDYLVEVEPEIVAHLPEKAQGGEILKLKDNLYFYGPSDNSLYRLNPADKTLTSLKVGSINLGRFRLAVPIEEDNAIVFYTEGPGLAIYDATGDKLASLKSDFAFNNINIQDIANYGANIYLLDRENNQIIKQNKILGGYGESAGWLEQPANFKDAKSLAIDGAIYVLDSDGQISKYFTGKKEEFKISQPFKPLNQPTKIFTQPDMTNLYILDPNNKRVVVFDKEGSLVKQYASEKFDDLKDIWVVENQGKIYLLDGLKVFLIKM